MFLSAPSIVTAEDQNVAEEKIRELNDLMEVRKKILDQVFNPDRFVGKNGNYSQPIIGVVYTGDDWAWPVYATGIFRGCRKPISEDYSGPCEPEFWALKLSAATNSGTGRPRHAGSRLTQNVYELLQSSTATTIDEAMSRVNTDWQFTTFSMCPSAQLALDDLGTIDLDIAALKKHSGHYLHSDYVTIKIKHAQQSITVKSPVNDPFGKWATALDEALQYCWQPAKLPKPWELNEKE